MEYKLLTEDEKYEHVASYLKGQESDHCLHCINRDRYKKILSKPGLTPKFVQRIEKLLAETEERIEEVGAIIDATWKDFPDAKVLKAGLARLEKKRAAQK